MPKRPEYKLLDSLCDIMDWGCVVILHRNFW
nr:MAG TPA: hypothetical protein [Caudoviricetes sp.]